METKKNYSTPQFMIEEMDMPDVMLVSGAQPHTFNLADENFD